MRFQTQKTLNWCREKKKKPFKEFPHAKFPTMGKKKKFIVKKKSKLQRPTLTIP